MSDTQNPPAPGTAPPVIAIDGPAASGKSSVARALARRLGFAYCNSGALYRAATAFVLARGLDPAADPAGVTAALAGARVACAFSPGDGGSPVEARNRFDGREFSTEELRAEAINAHVSPVAKIAPVRERLTARLRALADAPPGGGLVMEGRDIGSAVFPHTPFKFYVDASPEVRAARRAAQGGGPDEIARRDWTDSTRRANPLTVAEDAHVIDSSRLTIDGVVGELIGRLKLRGLLPTER